MPSGELRYPADPAAHFYVSNGARYVLGMATAVTFDDYHLLTERVTIDQAAWSVTTAVNDYRVLGPSLVTDPNGQRRAVRYDEWAGWWPRRCSAGPARDGDTLDDPTLTFTYDPFNWVVNGQPAYSRGRHRERHGPTNTRWLESYEYSTGTGGVAITKSRVHPGRALEVGEDGVAVEVDADPRWVGTGRTVVNNKGNPVKRYQPYFSTTHEYEDAAALREIGATAIRYYDPLGRAVLTRYPDGTLSRVESTAWSHRLFDANDTVLDSQWYAERGSPAVSDPEPADPATRAAWLAATHADTPSVVHFDSLGRAVYTVADRGARPAVRCTHQGRPHRPVLGRVRRAGPAIANATTAMHGGGGALVERGEGRAVGVPGRSRRGAPDLGRTRPNLPHHVRRPAPARRPATSASPPARSAACSTWSSATAIRTRRRWACTACRTWCSTRRARCGCPRWTSATRAAPNGDSPPTTSTARTGRRWPPRPTTRRCWPPRRHCWRARSSAPPPSTTR